MAYTINLTDGTIFAVIADGTINTDSSMTLVGKNYAGYGEFLDENFIHLLENSANTTAPGDPLIGQLWWDKTNDVLKVYTGVNFKVISTALASASAPTQSLVTGDLWYDTVNAQLKVFNGSGFILVGPAFTAGTGTSGAIVDTVTDSSPGADHVVVKVFVNNTIVSIFSKDATFTPAAALSGFSTIGPGLNMSTTVAGAVFNGTATNADLLDNLTSSQFMRSDTNTSTSGTLSILNDTGLYVGGDSDGRLFVQGTDVYLRNQTLDGDIYIQVNDGWSTTSPIVIDGATSNVTILNGLTVGGTISSTGGSVNFGTAAVSLGSIINNNANGVGNIGSSSGYFNTIFAKATSAEYADLAERFEADAAYPPGTVVMLGGEKEITAAMEEATDDVFGVISTRPAYTMNGAAGDDATHPPIAMTGRVPVLVVGQVRKGDRLISAGHGLARAARQGEATAFNVIGRALTSKVTEDEGTVEAIVTIN
jgi:hypothetical protein